MHFFSFLANELHSKYKCREKERQSVTITVYMKLFKKRWIIYRISSTVLLTQHKCLIYKHHDSRQYRYITTPLKSVLMKIMWYIQKLQNNDFFHSCTKHLGWMSDSCSTGEGSKWDMHCNKSRLKPSVPLFTYRSACLCIFVFYVRANIVVLCIDEDVR